MQYRAAASPVPHLTRRQTRAQRRVRALARDRVGVQSCCFVLAMARHITNVWLYMFALASQGVVAAALVCTGATTFPASRRWPKAAWL